jgi:RNA polymerase sigma-70 factor, ECF subfamily
MTPYEPSISDGRARATSPDADERLVRLAVANAKQGSRSALQFLYVRYAADTHRYVRSIVGDLQEAEEITQNVFARLRPSLSSYDPARSPFGAWLRRAARNAAVDALGRPRAAPAEGTEVEDAEPELALLPSMKRALGRLPHEQQEVLILRHLIGVSPREIARMLQTTESAVNGLLDRARERFRSALEELEAVRMRA